MFTSVNCVGIYKDTVPILGYNKYNIANVGYMTLCLQ